MNDLPVILSYFAQHQEQTYLNRLEEEQNGTQQAWEKAKIGANPIKIEYLSRDKGRSHRAQIVDDITTYGNRIVLFQFSGHAGPDVLQLSDGEAGPDGIAGLLQTNAPNLRLVVLNGCSTHDQVETLFQRGIRVVVATSCAVTDKHAMQFAISFHQRLGAGKSIQDAYQDAISVLRTMQIAQSLPPDLREAAVSRSMLDTSNKTGTLWGLYIQDTEAACVDDLNWWAINGRPEPDNFYEAAQYRELRSQLDELNNDFSKARAKAIKYPNDMDFQADLIYMNDKRNNIQQKIDDLKGKVIKLADQFTRILPNTERLRLAKKHFDVGEYEKARAIFDTEIDLMKSELDELLEQKSKLEAQTAENIQNLISKANEYLVLARLTAIDFELPKRFEQTNVYFNLSLKADRNPDNLFAYGNFLQEHNQFNEATPYYEETLQIYQQLTKTNPQVHLPNLAKTLNYLANLLTDLNVVDQALPYYEEALKIRRQLAQVDPQVYLPDVSGTLNNLANLLAFDQAQPCYEEALKIYRQVAQENPQVYLPNVAGTLNNLAILLADHDSFDQAQLYYEEALKIYQQVAQENPQVYLPNVAMTLNNLANLLADSKAVDQAQSYYEEALKIRRNLAQTNPQAYLPSVAKTLNNLALLLTDLNELNQAQSYYEEALSIRRELAQTNPQAYLPYVAMTLNNLAVLFTMINAVDQAQSHYEEALKIRRQLAKVNPLAYLPIVAKTTLNMCQFYYHNNVDKVRSLQCAEEAIRVGLLLKDDLPELAEIIEETLCIVEAWAENRDAFLQRIINDTKEQAELSTFE